MEDLRNIFPMDQLKQRVNIITIFLIASGNGLMKIKTKQD